MKNSSKKEVIFETATALFAEHGFHAIGIDRIISESNVAKMTLYKYFPSKEHLIESILLRRDEQLRESILKAINEAETSLSKLKAIFDWYENWFEQPNFHGCMFIKATEEFPSTLSKIRTISQNHKLWLVSVINDILIAMGSRQAAELSNFILITLDGLTVNANIFTNFDHSKVGLSWQFIEVLIKQSL